MPDLSRSVALAFAGNIAVIKQFSQARSGKLDCPIDTFANFSQISPPMSLNEVWEGAAASPFYPAVSKDRQFLAGSTLLLTGNLNHMEVGNASSRSLTTASFYPDWIVRAQ
jgi:hypothetical protein